MSQSGDPSPGATEALKALRVEIEAAHWHVQTAQRIAYGALRHERRMFWTQLALNKAQSILIKQLVHRLKDVPPVPTVGAEDEHTPRGRSGS